MTRWKAAFAALVLFQAAHSVEEYAGRLWETFPPARVVSGLVSSDPARGFLVLNVALVAFGAWCVLWPARRDWPSATAFAWGWVVLETINGIGHIVWAFAQGGYAPGVATAPLLLAGALYLGRHLPAPSRRPLALTPERLFLLGFVALFLVFFVILIVQPTSVGRGGR